MHTKTGWRFFSATVIFLVAIAFVASAEERTWTDKTGKFSVSAELVKVEEGKAVLRRADGKQIKVPVDQLSESDKKFLNAHGQSDPAADTGSAGTAIAEIAARFYSDLRNQERTLAKQSLTKKAIRAHERRPVAFGRSSPAGAGQQGDHAGERFARRGDGGNTRHGPRRWPSA